MLNRLFLCRFQLTALKLFTNGSFVEIQIWPISSWLRQGNNSYFTLHQIDCVIRMLARIIPAIVGRHMLGTETSVYTKRPWRIRELNITPQKQGVRLGPLSSPLLFK